MTSNLSTGLLAQDFHFEAVGPNLFFPNFFSTAGAGKGSRVICASYVQWQHLDPTLLHIFPSILPNKWQ
jgi:hypothetical protein